jgi:tRNA(fMet)-specific endonuclease VapC
MYLLDTNICIYAINRKPASVINAIKEKSVLGLYISSITLAELEYGIENSLQQDRNRIALQKFISVFNVLDFDAEDAISYGKLRSRLKRTGKLIGPLDMLLAAQALSKDLVFVTNNASEFERVEGLQVEDWSR